MAKLRMPVSSEFKVFTGEGNGSISQGGGNGEVHSDVPFDTDEPTAADTATAMLEGDDGPEGGVDCDPLGDYGDGLPVLDETPVDIEQPTALADEPEPILVTPEEIAADNAADAGDKSESMPIPDAAWAKYRARREWQENCEIAKEKFVAAALAHAELKAATKAAKVEEEDAMEAYTKLLKQNPDYNPSASPMNTRPVAEVKSYDGPADAESTTLVESSGEASTAATSAAPPPNTDTSWRSRPITELSGSITPKIIERLQEDGIHTIGQLEDRRAKCYDNTGEWPKGIGKVKITAIEDALLDWLTANRDKAVFAELESGHASEQAAEVASDDGKVPEFHFEGMGEAIEAIERNGGKVDNGLITITPGCAESDQAATYLCCEWDCVMAGDDTADDATSLAPATSYTTPDDVAAMIRRSQQINDGSDGCLSSKYLDAIWTEGYEAFQAGKSFEQCDYRPGNTQDDWLRGWMAAQATKDYPAAEDSKASPVLASTPLFDPDDI